MMSPVNGQVCASARPQSTIKSEQIIHEPHLTARCKACAARAWVVCSTSVSGAADLRCWLVSSARKEWIPGRSPRWNVKVRSPQASFG